MKLHWPFTGARREENAAWPLVALSEPRAASWGSREAGALTRDGCLRNAVAYRCVRMVAEAAASIPLKTAQKGAARLIRAPMPEASTASFLEALYTEILLTGNGFVEAVRLPGETAVAAMFPVKTSAVRPLKDARGWGEAWVIKGQGRERRIGRDADGWSPVMQVKLYNPADDAMGLPPLAAARRPLDLHNAGADWAKALIDNAAKPSGALVDGGGGRMPPDQFDRLQEELAHSFSGAGNAGRPMLLGIPGDNTYSNYREANAAFWRMTAAAGGARGGGAVGLAGYPVCGGYRGEPRSGPGAGAGS